MAQAKPGKMAPTNCAGATLPGPLLQLLLVAMAPLLLQELLHLHQHQHQHLELLLPHQHQLQELLPQLLAQHLHQLQPLK
jgi:hypothetical protein